MLRLLAPSVSLLASTCRFDEVVCIDAALQKFAGKCSSWPDFLHGKRLMELHTGTHLFLTRCRRKAACLIRVYECHRSGLPSWLRRKARNGAGLREAKSKRTGCGASLVVKVPWAIAISNKLALAPEGTSTTLARIEVKFNLHHSKHPALLGSVADISGQPTFSK